jgi:hypothetical protein
MILVMFWHDEIGVEFFLREEPADLAQIVGFKIHPIIQQSNAPRSLVFLEQTRPVAIIQLNDLCRSEIGKAKYKIGR